MKKRLFALCVAAILLFLYGCGTASTDAAGGGSGQTSGSDISPEEIGSSPGADGVFQVYCFSAGKADAILLSTAKSAVLIDTGESGFGREILSYLKSQGISSLDALVLTHFDQDHVGGAARVLKNIPVKQVLQSNCPKNSDEYEKYLAALKEIGLTPVTVKKTTTFTFDGVTYTVYPPLQESYASKPSNNSSLIVAAVYSQTRFLFAGDAENARLQEFLSENTGQYDFLKVPYHGRYQSSLPALFDAVHPSYAVITSSDEIPEDEATVAALEKVGAQVFLTRTAPVLATSDGTTVRVCNAA